MGNADLEQELFRRAKARDAKMAMDPLTEKGNKIHEAMTSEYGEKKGEQVFYASRNAGKIKGVDVDNTKTGTGWHPADLGIGKEAPLAPPGGYPRRQGYGPEAKAEFGRGSEEPRLFDRKGNDEWDDENEKPDKQTSSKSRSDQEKERNPAYNQKSSDEWSEESRKAAAKARSTGPGKTFGESRRGTMQGLAKTSAASKHEASFKRFEHGTGRPTNKTSFHEAEHGEHKGSGSSWERGMIHPKDPRKEQKRDMARQVFSAKDHFGSYVQSARGKGVIK